MPDYTQYPQGPDVAVLLKSAGLWPEGDESAPKVQMAYEQAAIGARAAWQEWETRTGWTPFLAAPDALSNPASTSVQTRTFMLDPRTYASAGVVSLGGGLLRLDGVRLNEQPLLASRIVLTPSDARPRNVPYTTLRDTWAPYYGGWGGWVPWQPVRVEVTGVWGYCTEVPGDVWEQLNQRAALFTLTQIENLQSIASVSQDGFSKAYDVVGIISQKDLSQIWSKDFDRFVERYKRVS